MKKITLYAITMVFVLSLGVAYAEAGTVNLGSNKAITNTNFDIGPANVPAASVEGANAGGIHGNQAITNTNFDIGPADVPATSMEGANAGGLRSEESGISSFNGITDFTGRTYDVL